MQQTINPILQQKGFNNAFCDAERTALTHFLSLDDAIKNFDAERLSKLSRQEILDINKYAVLKNLAANVKEITLRSINPAMAAQAMKELSIGGRVLFDAQKITYRLMLGDSLEQNLQDLIAEYNAGGNIQPCLYVEDILALSERQLNILSEVCAKHNLPLYISFYRTLEMAGGLDKIFNMSPARVLEDFGLLDRKTTLVGNNFLDKEDAKILASYNSEVVITPQADMMLGRGAINLVMLISENLKILLGSDCYSHIDMQEEAKLALGNTANLMHDPFAVSAQTLTTIIASDKQTRAFVTDKRYQQQKEKVKHIIRSKF